MRVPADHPQRGGIDQVHLAPHQFAEGLLRSALGEVAEQLRIIGHTLFNY